jgi:hypothetical protein
MDMHNLCHFFCFDGIAYIGENRHGNANGFPRLPIEHLFFCVSQLH